MNTAFFSGRRFLRGTIAVLALAALGVTLANAQTATLTAASSTYSSSGGNLTLTATISYPGLTPSALSYSITLPTGWTYVSTGGSNVPSILPDAGSSGLIDFSFVSFPGNSVTFTVTVAYPAAMTGDKVISAAAQFRSPLVNLSIAPVTVIPTAAATAPTFAPASGGTHPTSQSTTAGQSVTFTALAIANPAPAYQWRKEGSNLPGATNATYVISTVTAALAGTYDVVASNAAGTATSNPATLTVAKAAQTITFGALAAKSTGDAAFTLTATASSGLPVSYASSNPAVATISGSTVTLVGAGSTTITASQAGSPDFLAAPEVAQILSVSASLATLAVAPTNSVYSAAGGQATFNVTLTYPATTAAVGLRVLPPSNWSYVSTAGANPPSVSPMAGDLPTPGQGFAWAFVAIPANTASFSFTLQYPAGLTGNVSVEAVTLWRDATGGEQTVNAPAMVFVSAPIVPVFSTHPAGTTVNVGQAVTLTAAATGLPAPTYQWRKSGANVTGATNPTLVFSSVTTADASTYDVVATNAGGSATSNSATLTVNKLAQTITFGALAARTFGDAAFSLGATASSGLPVSYASSNPSVATISGNSVTLLSAGSTTITATQAGNADYLAASSVAQTLTVTKAPATVTIDAASLAQTFTGAARVITATTTPAGLPLAITYAGSATPPTNVGSYAIVATVNDPRYQGSATGTLVVAGASQTIAFATIPTKALDSGVFSLAATASSGLPVTYTTSNASSGTVATVSGSTVTLVNAGSITITATQPGNANFAPAAAVSQVLTVLNQSQIVTFDAAQLPAKTFGDAPFTIQAASNRGLPVTFSSSNPGVATVGPSTLAAGISSATVTLVGSGTTNLTASQAGDANTAAAPDVARSLSVNKAPANVVLGGLAATYDGTPKPAVATTVPAGLNVVFAYGAAPGSPTPPFNAGTYAVTATLQENSYVGSASGNLVIAKAAQAIVFPTPAARAVGDAPSPLGATASSGLPVTYTSSNSGVATISGGNAVIVGIGNTTLTASQAGDANYLAAADVTRSLTVTSAPLWASLTADQVSYSSSGGTVALTATVDYSGVSAPAALGFSIGIPVGWALVSTGGPNVPSVVPAAGTTQLLEFAYTSFPVQRVSFVVTVSYPPGLTANQTITASAQYRSPTTNLAINPIVLPLSLLPTITSFTPTTATAGTIVTINGTSFADASAVRFNGMPAASFTVVSPTQITAVVPGAATTGPISVTTAAGSVSSATNLTVPLTRALVNLSSRCDVGVGERALVASFTVEGSVTKTLLLRGVGPKLAGFGISGVLADPVLTVHDATGAQIATNDDWGSAATAPTVVSAMATAGAFPLDDGAKDAALVRSFAPGTYSVRLSGKNDTTGTALLEVYDTDSGLRLPYLGVRGFANSTPVVAGFLIAGTTPQRVLVRAVGPGLYAAQPGSAAVANPSLSVYDSNSSLLAANDDWGTSADLAALAEATSLAGAMPLAAGSLDSAVLLTLAPGSYTVQGAGGSGVVQVEVYQIDGYRAATAAPALTAPLLGQTVNAGTTVVFSAAHVAKSPVTAFQWRRNGLAIAGATQSALNLVADATTAGAYSVVMTNVVGTTTSASATLALNAPPTISVQPVNQAANVGGAVTFAVTASATPAPTYQWKFNGVALPGATNATYTLASAQLIHVGAYSVTVSNPVGSVTSNSVLLGGFNAAPTIITPPSAVAATAGQSAVFTVSASGTGGLGYQWRRNGVPIAGATGATLTLGATTRSDADYYDVLVGDGLSLTTSAAARLTVAPSSYPSALVPDPAWNLLLENLGATINATLPLPDGRYYVAGLFTSANGTRSPMVIRALADGSVDPTFAAPEIDNTIRCLAVQADGRLIIGGDFVRVGGVLRNRLARLMPNGSVDASFTTGTGANGSVLSLTALGDGRTVVAGSFSTFNGATTGFLTRLNADGSADSTFNPGGAGANGTVNSVARRGDGGLLIGGSFTTYNGVTAIRLVLLTPEGVLDASFNPGSGPNSTVSAIGVAPDGNIVIGGLFSTYNSVTANRLIRITGNGTFDSAFSVSGSNVTVNSIHVQDDGRMLVAGNFTAFNSNPTYHHVVRLSYPQVGLDSSFVSSVNGAVQTVSRTSAGQVLVGGSFTSPAPGFARLTADGLLDPAGNLVLRGGTNVATAALPQAGGKVIVTGNFDRLRNAPAIGNIARCNADGSLDPTFNAGGVGANGTIYAAAQLPEGRIAITGTFTSYNGVARGGVAVLNGDGTLHPVFSPVSGINGTGFAVAALPGGRVAVGGSFSTANGVSFGRVAVFLPDGTLDPGFNLISTAGLAGITLLTSGAGYTSAPTVTISGGGGSGATATAIFDVGTGQVIGFTLAAAGSGYTSAPSVTLTGGGGAGATAQAVLGGGVSGANGTVNALLAQPDGKLLVGGSFTTFSGFTVGRVARLNANGAVDPTFNSGGAGASSTVYGLALQPDGRIFIAGAFTTYNTTTRNGVVRLNSTGTLDSSFSPVSSTSVLGLLLQEDGKVILRGSFASAGGAANTAYLARLTATGAVDTTFLANGVNTVSTSFAALALRDNGQLVSSNALTGFFGGQPALPPTIVTPPTSQVASLGGNATFSVGATSGLSLAFQWLFNGTPIAGATNPSYAITNAQRSQAGSYAVEVSNEVGTVTSPTVTLSGPAPAPTVTAAPQSATVVSGQAANFTVTATGSGALAYQWRRNGLPIAGATGTGLALPAASRLDADFYDVVVYDGLSSAVSAAARLAVAPLSYPTRVAPDPAWNLGFESDGGTVNVTLPLPDGRFYVGGSFVNVNGTRSPMLFRANPDGTLDGTFTPAEIDGDVQALAMQADGKLMIGGSFSLVNGVSRNRLARLQSNGALDPTFAPGMGASGTVYALAVQADGRIIVGGAFSTYNGTTVNFLTRVWTDGTIDGSFSQTGTAATSTVYAVLVLPDQRILIGGVFSSFNGATTGRIVRLNANGSLDGTFAAGTGANSTVRALALQVDGSVLLGGDFTSYNGTTIGRLARITSTGTLDTTFAVGATGFSSTVYSILAQADGIVLVGGNFTTLNGSTVNYFTRLSATAARLGGPTPNGTVFTLGLLPDGRLLLGGGFTTFNGVARTRLARMNTDLSVDTALNPTFRTMGSISAILPQPGGKVLLGGSFGFVRGSATLGNLVRVNSDGTVDATFNSGGLGANGSITAAVALPDGRIALGGSFTSYNGAVRNRIAVINADGTLDPAFNPAAGGPSGGVNAVVALSGGRLLVAGSFSTANGVARPNVAVFNSDGSLYSGFNPGTGPSSTVYAAAAQQDGKILLGGAFSGVNGIFAGNVARLLPNGTVDPTFTPGGGASSTVYSVAVLPDGRIMFAGSFSSFNGLSRSRVVRLLPDGVVDDTFVPSPAFADGAVYAALPQEDGRVLVRGSFTGLTGAVGTAYLARLNPDGSRDLGFAADDFSSVTFVPNALALRDNGQLLLSSNFVGFAATRPNATTPLIVASPVNQTAAAGSTVAFSVSALGIPAPSYQWNFNGSPLPGATGFLLAVNNVQAANVGSYSVTVTNPSGAVTSAYAALTVQEVGTTGRQFVAVGQGGAILTSPDGQTWTPRTSGTALRLRAIVATPNLFAVVGEAGTILTSPDGVSWTLRASTSLESLRGLAVGPSRYVAVGGAELAHVVVSDDGVNWSVVGGLPTAGRLRAVAWGNGRYLAVGSEGTVLTSPDGLVWTPRTSGATERLDGVKWAGSRFQVLGASGRIYTTIDGIAWSMQQVNSPTWVEALAWSDSRYVVVGAGGNVALSPSGAFWSMRPSGVTGLLHGLAWSGATLVPSTDPFGLVENLRQIPTLTAPPQSLAVLAGQSATLSVVAAGPGALSYQWTKDGAALPGATGSSLILAPAVVAHTGAYAVTVTGSFGSVASPPAALSVTKAPATVALAGLNQTYDATPRVVSATTTPAGLAVTITYNGSPAAPTAAGSYPVVASVNEANYEGSASGTLVVARATQAIEFGGQANRTYGDAPFAVSATSSSGLPVTFTVVNGPAAVAGNLVTISGAGSVTLRASQAGDANFQAANSVDRTLTVAKKTLLVTAENRTRAYGGGSPAFTATLSGFVNGDTSAAVVGGPTLSSPATLTSGVGTYPINVALGTLTALNYDFSFAAGTLTVTKAALTARADSKTRAYGAANPALTISYTGFANGETATVLNTAPTAATTATPASDTGVYPITVTGGADDNYTLSYADGTLTITPATQTITFAALADKVVGDAAFTVAATASSGLPVQFTLVQGPATLADNLVTLTGAGTVTLQASQAGNANYQAAAPVTRSFAVNIPVAITTPPADVTVVAGQTATFTVAATGVPAPTYQWRKDGAPVAGATAATYAVASAQPTHVGLYDVVVTNVVNSITSPTARLTVNVPPEITTHPGNRVAAVDTGVTFSVAATGTAPLTYEWRKNGGSLAGDSRITGVATPTLSLAGLIAADAGNYDCVITNVAGIATSRAAVLSVVDARATHLVAGSGYFAGSTVKITSRIVYSGACSALGWNMLLPDGWTYAGGEGTEGDIKPSIGTASVLEWAWTSVPASPVEFSVILNVPATDSGDKQVAATTIFRSLPGPLTMLVKPDPLVVTQLTNHDADSDRNFRISLLELTRVIELYNTRNGSSRTGCYKVDAAGEDGFNPEPTRTSSAVVTLSRYHSADSDRNGKISLLELTRVIELYNYRVGSSRTGDYHVHPGSEDGYNPGPLSTHPTQ